MRLGSFDCIVPSRFYAGFIFMFATPIAGALLFWCFYACVRRHYRRRLDKLKKWRCDRPDRRAAVMRMQTLRKLNSMLDEPKAPARRPGMAAATPATPTGGAAAVEATPTDVKTSIPGSVDTGGDKSPSKFAAAARTIGMLQGHNPFAAAAQSARVHDELLGSTFVDERVEHDDDVDAPSGGGKYQVRAKRVHVALVCELSSNAERCRPGATTRRSGVR